MNDEDHSQYEDTITILKETAFSSINGIDYSIKNYRNEELAKLIEALVDAHKANKKIVVSGKGNSGSVGEFFVRRGLHLDYNISFIEDAGCPALKPDDIALFISGSGTTSGVVNQAKIAKDIGAQVVLVTSSKRNSEVEDKTKTVQYYSDLVIEVGGKTKEQREQRIQEYGSRQIAGEKLKNIHKGKNLLILGTQFELNALVFLMSTLHALMPLIGVTEEKAWERHKKME